MEFNPAFPLPLLLGVLAAALGISLFSYWRQLSSSRSTLWLALLSRMLALAILFLLLLDPLMVRRGVQSLPPQWHLYVDASSSMAVARGTYAGTADYTSTLERLLGRIPEGVDLRVYSFQDQVVELAGQGALNRPLEEISQALGAGELQSTSLQAVARHLSTRSTERSSLALVLSDGVETAAGSASVGDGSDLVGGLPLPVYTLALGDRITGPDLALQDVVVSEPTRVDSGRVSFVLSKTGGPSRLATVRLTLDGRTESFDVPLTKGAALVRISRALPPFSSTQPWLSGTVEVDALPDEWIRQNNSAHFHLVAPPPVLDVYSLVFGLHPDNGALHRVLLSEPGIRLHILNKPDRESLLRLAEEIGTGSALLLYLHGGHEGGETGRANSETGRADAETGRMDGLLTPQKTLANLPSFHFHRSQSRERSVVPQEPMSGERPAGVNDERPTHPVLEGIGSDLPVSRRPELDAPVPLAAALDAVRDVQMSMENGPHPPAQDLLRGLGGRGSGALVMAAVDNGPRQLHMLSSGWHRYLSSPDDDVQTFARDLILQGIAWLRQPPQRERMSLQPSPSTVSQGRNQTIRVRIVDELGRPDGSQTPDLLVESNGERRKVPMLFDRDGIYQAQSGRLDAGVARFWAEAQINGMKSISGRDSILVVPQDLELQRIGLDTDRLASLSMRTGGFAFTDIGALEDWMDAVQVTPMTITRSTASSPTQKGAWFFLVVTLFTLEWWLRRRFQLP